jgi:hypothetical protein
MMTVVLLRLFRFPTAGTLPHIPSSRRYEMNQCMYDACEIIEMAQHQSLYRPSLLSRSEGDAKA